MVLSIKECEEIAINGLRNRNMLKDLDRGYTFSEEIHLIRMVADIIQGVSVKLEKRK